MADIVTPLLVMGGHTYTQSLVTPESHDLQAEIDWTANTANQCWWEHKS